MSLSRDTSIPWALHPANPQSRPVSLADAPVIVAAALRKGYCRRADDPAPSPVKTGTNPQPERVYLMAASVDMELARWLSSKSAPREIHIRDLEKFLKLTYHTSRKTLKRWTDARWMARDSEQVNAKYYTLTPKGVSRCAHLLRASGREPLSLAAGEPAKSGIPHAGHRDYDAPSKQKEQAPAASVS